MPRRPCRAARARGYRAAPPHRRSPPVPTGGENDNRKIGAIAQLGERFNGIEEVVGSIPSGSTTYID